MSIPSSKHSVYVVIDAAAMHAWPVIESIIAIHYQVARDQERADQIR
jgi:hypothetical protein